MKHIALPLFLFATFCATAQYGAVNPAQAKAVRTNGVTLVLSGQNTALDAAIGAAADKSWSYGDLSRAMLPDVRTEKFLEGQSYLVHHTVTDPTTHTMHMLSVVNGWKMKKGEEVTAEGDHFTGIPETQVIASILFDPELVDKGRGAMLNLYVKHLQDYLLLVANGKVSDKTTTSRVYEGRTSEIKEAELRIVAQDVDATMKDKQAEIAEIYKGTYTIISAAEAEALVAAPDATVFISDVVLTGDGKKKHAFKRIFNAATGELVYLADEPSLFGKKEGFLIDDMKSIARAR